VSVKKKQNIILRYFKRIWDAEEKLKMKEETPFKF